MKRIRPKTADSSSQVKKIRPKTADSSSQVRKKNNKNKKNSSNKGLCNVKVVVRARPPSQEEIAKSNPQILSTIGMKEIAIRYKSTKKVFTFDRVYSQYTSQEELFNYSVKPLVNEVLDGYNATIFAYGQTGTGKTYTMEGNLDSNNLDKNAGVIQIIVYTIFKALNNRSQEFY